MIESNIIPIKTIDTEKVSDLGADEKMVQD